jgi:hypothetical protein
MSWHRVSAAPACRAGALVLLAGAALAPAAALAQRVTRPGGEGTAGVRPGGAGRPAERPADASARSRGAAEGRRVPGALADSLRSIAVVGTVYDSLAAAPLARATVQWASPSDPGRTYTTQTDSAGRYRLPAVRLGRYLVGFFHPDVDAIGVELPPIGVELGGDTTARVDLATPGPALILPALCGNNAPAQRPGGASLGELLRPPRPGGALLGAVRDADTGEPIPNARVVVTWTELQAAGALDQGTTVRNVNRRVPVRARADGGFVACGLPSGVDLVANADAPKRQSGLVEVRLEPGQLARRDFALGDSASVVTVTLPDTAAAREGRLAVPVTVARGQARLSGVVRAPGGAPLANARVSVAGTDVAGTTSPNGAFSLAGLPAGTYSLEVRALGYAPTRVAVNLSRTRPAAVAVTVNERLSTLETVVVQADRTRLQKDYTGFAERSKRGGFGRFITEADINRRNPMVLTDVLRTVPGVRVVPNGQFGYTVQGRGNCTPDLFIDGMRVLDGTAQIDQLVRPTDVAGVEVYTGGAGAPAQLQGPGGSACGVVAVWSRRGQQ